MDVKRFMPGDSLGDAHKVRDEVFVVEQRFSPESEIDDIDALAHHVVLYDKGRPVATARTFPDRDVPARFIIGRVAVLREYRGGTGLLLMREIEAFAEELGARSFSLGAQVRASGFYRKCGYEPYGEHYYDEYCEHVHMEKIL